MRIGALPAGTTAVLDVALRAPRPAGPNQLEIAVFASDAGGAKGELLNRSFAFLASEEEAPVPVDAGHVLVEVHNGGSVATTYTGRLDLRLHDAGGPRPDGLGVPATRVSRAPGAHLDPDVARDPRDPSLLLAAFERFPDPRARLRAARDVRAAAASASFDGGRTWADLGDLTDLHGGHPRVALDDAGTAYALTTAGAEEADGLQLRRWASPSAQDVARGETFGPPVDVIAAQDRPEVVGTELGRGALAVGTAGPDGATPGPLVACTSHVQTAQPVAVVRCLRSTDGGRTFEPAVMPPTRFTGFGPDLVADPRDEQTFHLTFLDFSGNVFGFVAPGTTDRLPSATMYARSTDGGRTWSPPVAVIEAPDRPYPFVHPPVSTLPRIAVDGRQACITTATWSGARPDVVLACGLPGGRWETPRPVAADAAVSEDVPAVAFAPGGRLDLAWSDRGRDRPAPGNDGDWWADEQLRQGAAVMRTTQRARDPQATGVLRGFFSPNMVSPVSLTRALLSDDAGTLTISSDQVPGEPRAQLVARRVAAR